jgi:hypothetical protein
MLHSYQAQLNGSELIWIDAPPPSTAQRRVLVVVDDAESVAPTPSRGLEAHAAFMQAQGCLGSANRAEVDAQLSVLRNEWDSTQRGMG